MKINITYIRTHRAFFILTAFTEDSLAVGLARVGSEHQRIVACTIKEMRSTDLGQPLHCLVIPADTLHPLEYEYLIQYATDTDKFAELVKH